MAQTTTPPAPTVAPRRSRWRDAFAGTPGTLRAFGAVSVAATLLFGIVGFAAVSARSSSLATARSEAAQLVRLQRIHTNLVEADASATNAFLVGGLEPRSLRESYEGGIARASATLAEASAHGEADGVALGKVNDALSRYTGLVESARANNRQGFPVGVAYLKQASNLLQVEMLPTLSSLVDRSQRRVSDAYGRSSSATSGLWIGAAIFLAATLSAASWLAARTRRLVNVPLTAAVGVIVLATVVSTFLMGVAQIKADDVRDGAYADSVALAAARIAAFDAKSAESLTLISRGSGEAYDQRFDEQMAVARQQAQLGTHDRTVNGTLDSYVLVHQTIRTADESGDWDQAVAIATGPASDRMTANGAFRAFDTASGRELDTRATAIAGDLDDAQTPLTGLRWVLLALALAAAAAAWRGVAIRLREYE
ncbi:MAG: hypothetical protein JWN67_4459 [Actinomycetia bacterium]|nr:hypothetical protein [Actinomycetes bacterium]